MAEASQPQPMTSTLNAPNATGVAYRLADRLQSNTHALTVELTPPKGIDVGSVIDRVIGLKPYVDAINVPDCQRAILKMSSMAVSKLIQDHTGVEAVWQLTGRDRNLIALQADMLGAWALGIRTILPLTGDPVQIGDHAHVAKPVNHLDSLRMIDLVRQLNQQLDATGKELPKGGTGFTYGAALNPHRMARSAQVNRIQSKIEMQVQFFQTQPVYDLNPLVEAKAMLENLAFKVGMPCPKLLVGIIPPKSADFARFMNQKIIGVEIPEAFIDVLERSSDPKVEAVAYCVDLMAQFAPVVDGFHLMPVGMEKQASVLLDRCFTQQILKR